MGTTRDRERGWLAVCSVVALIVLLVGFGAVRAFSVSQPAGGVCYATDGNTVETTWIGRQGDFAYPSPSEGVITHHDDGSFTVVHTTLFVPLGKKVYLPMVGR